MRSDTNETFDQKRLLLALYKQREGCAWCGEADPVVLELHHRDPGEKNPKLAYTETRPNGAKRTRDMYTLGWIELAEEIPKCEVICSNCHRRMEYGESNATRMARTAELLKLKRRSEDRVRAFEMLGLDHPSRPDCANGHAPEWRYENGRGDMVCRLCERERNRRRDQRQKEA